MLRGIGLDCTYLASASLQAALTEYVLDRQTVRERKRPVACLFLTSLSSLLLIITPSTIIYFRYGKDTIKVTPKSKVFYVFSTPNIDNQPILYNNTDTLTITNTSESFIPTILFKTIKALEFINQHFQYQHLLRTNLSSFFRLDLLHNYIIGLPHAGIYEGTTDTDKSYNHLIFVSGAGITFSKDVVDLLIKEQSLLDYSIIDDVAIASLMRQKSIIPRKTFNRYDLVDRNSHQTSIEALQGIPSFHFRIKSPSNRLVYDQIILEKLYKTFYLSTNAC